MTPEEDKTHLQDAEAANSEESQGLTELLQQDRATPPAGTAAFPFSSDDFANAPTQPYVHPELEAQFSDLPLPFDLGHGIRLTKVSSRGGMGILYVGFDAQFQREVIVKSLLPEFAARVEMRKRFVNELQLTARLEHPAIVPVYGQGYLPDGRPYYVMRYIHGQTLNEFIQAHLGNLTAVRPRLLKIFESVCLGIAYAHTHRVVHRDVKSGNIIIAPFGVVKVLDWGVAKVLPGSPFFDQVDTSEIRTANDATSASEGTRPAEARKPGESTDRLTRFGLIVGTLGYIAPEQVRGEIEQIGPWSDVFGLGALLCEMLTGKPAYVASSGCKLLNRATNTDLDETYTRLDQSGAEAGLIHLVKRCLSPEPKKRPQDGWALYTELVQFLSVQPVAN